MSHTRQGSKRVNLVKCSCLCGKTRGVFCFHLNAQVRVFLNMFSQCAVTVAAIALYPIKDGLR